MEPLEYTPEGAEILQGKRILIAHQDPHGILVLEGYFLEECNIQTTVVKSCVLVLRELGMRSDYDFILLDFETGIFSTQFIISIIRESWKQIPILIYSDLSEEDLLGHGITEPSIQVSVSLEEVLEKIIEMLSRTQR